MHTVDNLRSVTNPRWDGNRVTFQIIDRERRVDCAISRAALLDIAERNHLPAAGWMACFLKSRERIEAVAFAKFRGRSRHAVGMLNIWSNDIDPSPPTLPVAVGAVSIRRCA
jgi:hypothetical protein